MWPRGEIIRPRPQPRPHSFWPRPRSRPHDMTLINIHSIAIDYHFCCVLVAY